MIDRNESVRDQIATIVQAGYSQRKTSVETADEIITALAFASDAEHWVKRIAAWDENAKLRNQLENAKKDTARLEHLIRRKTPKQFAKIVCYRLLTDSIAAIDAAMEGEK